MRDLTEAQSGTTVLAAERFPGAAFSAGVANAMMSHDEMMSKDGKDGMKCPMMAGKKDGKMSCCGKDGGCCKDGKCDMAKDAKSCCGGKMCERPAAGV